MSEVRFEHELIRGDVPSIYKLNPLGNFDGVSVTTSKDVAEVADAILKVRLNQPDSPLSKVTLRPVDLLDLKAEEWGYGMVMRTIRVGDRVIWEAKFPQKPSLESVPESFYDTTASLGLLLKIMGTVPFRSDLFPEGVGNQLLHPSLTIARNTGAMAVSFGKAVMPYLLEATNYQEGLVKEAMQAAWAHMMSQDLTESRGGYINARLNSLFLSCSRAAGLYDEDSIATRILNRGFRATTSNVDGSIQQLTLLMGVAAIDREARLHLETRDHDRDGGSGWADHLRGWGYN